MPAALALGLAWLAAGTAAPGEPAAAPGPDPIAALPLASGLSAPVAMAFAPGDADRLFVAEQIGRVRIVDLATRRLRPEPFLDIAPMVLPVGERGLLGLAFDPGYAANGFFYVAYIHFPTGDMRLARYTRSPDPDAADPGSEVILATLADYLGHNGGQLQFGPDGYLYFGSGDGSTNPQNDPDNNAQNGLSLHGKILRLDPHAPPDYIPPTNPHVGDPGTLDEVWARGLRNPWRFSFDRLTGDLYIADVGKAQREEIDFQPASSPGGENYGWRCMEGSLCTGFGGCTCFDDALTPPAFEVEHGVAPFACAIIGGYVYRGAAAPMLAGRYIYSDYCHAWFRSFLPVPDGSGGIIITDEIDHTPELNPDASIDWITTFGEDPGGELYFASIAGTAWKIVPLAEADCNGNGVADRFDIADGTSPDCNANGRPDACDLAAGTSEDCNGDDVPDECQFTAPVALSSPTLSPIGTGSPQAHVFPAPPPARGPVLAAITATADLGSTHEWIDARLNGVLIGTVFQSGAGNCPGGPNVATFVVPATVFNDAVAGGDATVDLTTSVHVNESECDPPSFVSITFEYGRLDPQQDRDGDGVPDVCACVADLDGSGGVGINDLLALLAAWGQQPGGPPDFDGGGVGITDLLRLLAAWGPCPASA